MKSWAERGVTLAVMQEAMKIGRGKLGGEKPGSPLYYLGIVDELLKAPGTGPGGQLSHAEQGQRNGAIAAKMIFGAENES
jgi:hypothetical protein